MADQQGATPAGTDQAATADDTSTEDARAQELLAEAVASQDGTAAPDDEPLGEAGKRALQREREARKAAEKAAAEAAAKVKEYEDAQLSEQQRLEKERDEARTAAASSGQKAALYKAALDYGLTSEDLELLDGVPADQIDERAKRLADRLAASKADNAPRVPRPDPSQGPRGPVDIDAQIADAESRGDVRESIRLKNQKLLSAANK